MREKLFELEGAAEFLRERGFGGRRVGIILGSGLGEAGEILEGAVTVDSGDIPGYPRSTVEGHQGGLAAGEVSGVAALVFLGRAHHYEGYEPLEVCAPVIVSRLLGAEAVIITTSSGAINPGFKPGEAMFIDDYIAVGCKDPLLGLVKGGAAGRGILPGGGVSDEALYEAASQAAAEAEIRLNRGVFGYATGPSYETRAEVRMLEFAGADAVSMSTVPEMAAAKALGMRTIGIAVLVNMAAGLHHTGLTHKEVQESAGKAARGMGGVLRRLIAASVG